MATTLKNTTINTTGYFIVPAGNHAQRPLGPSTGLFRFNTNSGYFEYFNGSYWRSIFP